MIDKALIEVLACPDCKADVELKNKKIVCKKCGKSYPVKNGVPILIIHKAGK